MPLAVLSLLSESSNLNGLQSAVEPTESRQGNFDPANESAVCRSAMYSFNYVIRAANKEYSDWMGRNNDLVRSFLKFLGVETKDMSLPSRP